MVRRVVSSGKSFRLFLLELSCLQKEFVDLKKSGQKNKQIRMALSDLKLIIIDEISVVSNTLLLHIHQQLKDILSTSNNCLFAGLSIIIVGDLY